MPRPMHRPPIRVEKPRSIVIPVIGVGKSYRVDRVGEMVNLCGGGFLRRRPEDVLMHTLTLRFIGAVGQVITQQSNVRRGASL